MMSLQIIDVNLYIDECLLPKWPTEQLIDIKLARNIFELISKKVSDKIDWALPAFQFH